MAFLVSVTYYDMSLFFGLTLFLCPFSESPFLFLFKKTQKNGSLGYLYTMASGTSFAVRVHDFRLYHEACRDVILRWMYPLVPDNATTGGVQTQYTYERGCTYKAPGVNLPRSVR